MESSSEDGMMDKESRFGMLGEVADTMLRGDCSSEVVGETLDIINGRLLEEDV